MPRIVRKRMLFACLEAFYTWLGSVELPAACLSNAPSCASTLLRAGSTVLAGMLIFSSSIRAGGRLLVHMTSETRKVAARKYASGTGELSVCEVKFAPALASFERMSARCGRQVLCWGCQGDLALSVQARVQEARLASRSSACLTSAAARFPAAATLALCAWLCALTWCTAAHAYSA